jgi:hypothetical protein
MRDRVCRHCDFMIESDSATGPPASRGRPIDSTRELLGTVFGLSAISVILRLVRRPYGLHAIGPQDHAIIQTHASHKAPRPIACEP